MSEPFKHPIWGEAATRYPFPIAYACRRLVDKPPADLWLEWETLSRDVLQAVLHFLSHILLTNLVNTGRQPAHLYHRIQAILSQPTAGHYVGFLRETARYYQSEGLDSTMPELIELLLASEVTKEVLEEENKPLIGLLVEYRNLWAHGRVSDESILTETVDRVRTLTEKLLESLEFLTRYPLELEDGRDLMGADPPALTREPSLVFVGVGKHERREVWPLLLKLRDQDLLLLEDHDLRRLKVAYRGSETYRRLTKRQTRSGEGAKLVEDLAGLLKRVRAVEAVLPHPDWGTFRERASVVTELTLSQYEDRRKYVPELFVPRPAWEAEGNTFDEFLRSERSLLTISGVQGTGKSALVAHLARRCLDDDHAVLLVNAQRFTYSEVSHSGNPFSLFFANLLHYDCSLDGKAFGRILKMGPKDRKGVIFIDAINEVEGLGVRWNRFRAFELVLDWIAGIAQPGLKVVLSFRLDAYEEFGYPQADTLPETLESFAFPGDNARHGWVTDLEPFGEAEARVLFEKHQADDEYGMAPAMSWSDILAGLADDLGAITENPLIFSIFLKSHHRATTVRTGRLPRTRVDRIIAR